MKNGESPLKVEPERVRIGEFVLDTAQLRLERGDGTPVHLTPRQFGALQLFARRAGDVLDKETLFGALWPGVVVEDNNLNQLMLSLRRALGDDPQSPRYIQTVPRRGFRLVAAVTPVDQVATATVSESASPANEWAQGQTSRRVWLLGAGALATALGAGWWFAQRPGPPVKPTAIAVLPFRPLVDSARNELLEVGMADSLIARLSRVPHLAVRSVGSVRRYAGPDQNALAAARELDVAWVVDGSLQQWGDRVRVTARLLRTEDGTAAWSGSFETPFTDVFDVQDQIGERVAAVLVPRLQPPGPTLLAAGGTRDFDAYQLYLGARQHAQSVRADGLQRSVELFEKAIARDARYALAFAGLSEVYRRQVMGADADPRDVLARSRRAAEDARTIEPDLAEAHAALGWVHFWLDWDWPAAEAAFRRAVRLNPSVVEAHFGLFHLLTEQGRADDGFAHLQMARALDPLSPLVNTFAAMVLLARGQAPEGRARLERVLEIAPDFWIAHLTLSGFHRAAGDTEEQVRALRRAVALADRSTQADAALGQTLARLGRAAEARAILDRLLRLQQSRYVPPSSIAMIYAGLGEIPLALDWLDRAYGARDPRLCYARTDGRWTSLRNEPRFRALLVKLDLDRVGVPTR